MHWNVRVACTRMYMYYVYALYVCVCTIMCMYYKQPILYSRKSLAGNYQGQE